MMQKVNVLKSKWHNNLTRFLDTGCAMAQQKMGSKREMKKKTIVQRTHKYENRKIKIQGEFNESRHNI